MCGPMYVWSNVCMVQCVHIVCGRITYILSNTLFIDRRCTVLSSTWIQHNNHCGDSDWLEAQFSVSIIMAIARKGEEVPVSLSLDPPPRYIRGVSRISVRGVLKVRPHTKSGGQFASGPIRKVGGGGGGGQFASGPIQKVGGGGGGDSQRWGGGDTFVWRKENTLSLIINGYNFDQGGAQALHTRERMNCRF